MRRESGWVAVGGSGWQTAAAANGLSGCGRAGPHHAVVVVGGVLRLAPELCLGGLGDEFAMKWCSLGIGVQHDVRNVCFGLVNKSHHNFKL